jgi:hypothetical protein
MSSVPLNYATLLELYDKPTVAKNGVNDSDRNQLCPSEAQIYKALFQPIGILKHIE